MMTTLSNVLKQLINEDDDLTVSELARLTGILQPVVHRLVSGETDNPKINTISPIADHFGITLDELVGRTPLPINKALKYRTNRKPLYIINWLEISNWLQGKLKSTTNIVETTTQLSEKAYALIVKDSTMSPRFPQGTILIIDPSLQPDNGDFVIVNTETTSQPMFKQIFYDGNDTYLKPVNPDFKTLYFDKNSILEFLGVVVETRTQLKETLAEKDT